MAEKDVLNLSRSETHSLYDEMASNSFYAESKGETTDKRDVLPQAPIYEPLDTLQLPSPRTTNQMITPRTYDGRSNPMAWLMHYEAIAAANQWRDEIKLVRVIGSVTGTAEDWLMNQRQITPSMTWATFKELLIARFKSSLDPIMKHESIIRVRQKGSDFSSYWEEKERHINVTAPEMSDTEKMHYLFMGLNPDLRNKALEVMVWQPVHNTEELRNLIKKIYELNLYKGDYSNRNPKVQFNVPRPRSNDWQPRKGIIKDSTEETPQTEGTNRYKNLECYNCHKMGHISTFCPDKKAEQGNERRRR